MQIIIIPIIFVAIGYIFLLMTELMPILNRLYFPWFGMVFCTAGSIFLLYSLHVSNTMKHADKPKKWKHLINYLRRDNTVVPIEGVRAYPGESFIDVQGLGFVEFLGKDCYYTWGDKKIIWGLENINFTPDPRYFNLTHLLWELGFTDSVDVFNVLNGLDVELMGRVYLKMLDYDKNHGVNRLVKDMQEYEGKVIEFEPTENIHDKIDNVINKAKRVKVKRR
jgi:hypothetical protein